MTLRVVIFEKARTVLLFILALLRISFMRCAGVSKVPEVKEPSNRISPWLTVLVSIVCSHRSRRLARRVGICMRCGDAGRLLECGVLK